MDVRPFPGVSQSQAIRKWMKITFDDAAVPCEDQIAVGSWCVPCQRPTFPAARTDEAAIRPLGAVSCSSLTSTEMRKNGWQLASRRNRCHDEPIQRNLHSKSLGKSAVCDSPNLHIKLKIGQLIQQIISYFQCKFGRILMNGWLVIEFNLHTRVIWYVSCLGLF